MYLIWTRQPRQGFGMVSVILLHIRISSIDVGYAVLERVPSGSVESVRRSWLDSWVVELGVRWLTGCVVNLWDKHVDRRGAVLGLPPNRNVEVSMGKL